MCLIVTGISRNTRWIATEDNVAEHGNPILKKDDLERVAKAFQESAVGIDSIGKANVNESMVEKHDRAERPDWDSTGMSRPRKPGLVVAEAKAAAEQEIRAVLDRFTAETGLPAEVAYFTFAPGKQGGWTYDAVDIDIAWPVRPNG